MARRIQPVAPLGRSLAHIDTFTYLCHLGFRGCPCLLSPSSTDKYHQGWREVVLAAVTSTVGRLLVGDYKIKAWRASGLLHPSIVTGIVRTIKHDMIASKMGELPPSELHSVENKLREILALSVRRA